MVQRINKENVETILKDNISSENQDLNVSKVVEVKIFLDIIQQLEQKQTNNT